MRPSRSLSSFPRTRESSLGGLAEQSDVNFWQREPDGFFRSKLDTPATSRHFQQTIGHMLRRFKDYSETSYFLGIK